MTRCRRAAVALTLVAGAACTSSLPAVDFEDSLAGPVSPAFDIPYGSFAHTPAGLVRTVSQSGTENGIDRPVARTKSGDYLSREFSFEVDVTIPRDHGDIAYVGFGEGENNREYDNEPTQTYLFRIHNLPRIPYYAIDVAIGDPAGGRGLRGQYRELSRVADYRPGEPVRVRIVHQAGRVTLSVPAVPGASMSFEIAKHRDLFGRGRGFLFLGNSSTGTSFRNASLRRP